MKHACLLVAAVLFLPKLAFGGPKVVGADPVVVEELRRTVETQGKIIADLNQQVTELRTFIQTLGGDTEAAKHFVDEQGEKNQKILQEFDNRLTEMENRFVVHSQQLEEIFGKVGGSTLPSATALPSIPATTSTTPAAAATPPSDETADYQKALSEINLQNYKEAINLFDQFLKKYPKGNLADNAQYWKGEAYFALKEYPKAVLEFEKVNKNYARSPKAPAARLKQGYALYEMKAYQDAKAFLQKLITQFPNSPEASLARERVAKIDRLLATGGNGSKPSPHP